MPKKSDRKKGQARKVGRGKRVPMRLEKRFRNAYRNKLRRVNRNRAKSGKPPLFLIQGYDIITGIPDTAAPTEGALSG